jgi:hypothetical protein
MYPISSSYNKVMAHEQLVWSTTHDLFLCLITFFFFTVIVLPGLAVTCLGVVTFPFPEGGLCGSALPGGISTMQFISLFVMSSLLTFSVRFAQLLGFKMK